MGIFFKKDFLIYWRDRKEMLIGLLMPLVLIAVLGFALPDWIENRTVSLDMRVAVVMEDQPEAGLRQFREALHAQSVPEDQASALADAAEQFHPVLLLEELLEGDALDGMVEPVSLDAEEAARQLEEGEAAAILTVPQGYTLAALNKLLLDEGEGASLRLTATEVSFKLDVLQDILDNFLRTLNFQFALGQAAAQEGFAYAYDPASSAAVGGREVVEGVRPITSFQYYSLSMAILFSLFIAMTTAGKAITEKREHVFARMLIAGASPIRYIAGKVASTFCLALLQMVVVLMICHFAFRLLPDRTPGFWLGLAAVIVIFCLSISALSALFVALSFRLEENAANSVMLAILMVIGTIGGSFVPVFILPDWLQALGEWTPNGLSLSILMHWVQQGTLEPILVPLLQLLVFTAVTIAAGVWIFPRRERV